MIAACDCYGKYAWYDSTFLSVLAYQHLYVRRNVVVYIIKDGDRFLVALRDGSTLMSEFLESTTSLFVQTI